MGPAVVSYPSRFLRKQCLPVKLEMSGRGHWSQVRCIASTYPRATDTTGSTVHGPLPLAHLELTSAAFSSRQALEDPKGEIYATAQGESDQPGKSMTCMQMRRLEALGAPHREELRYLRDLLTQVLRYRTAEACDEIENGAAKDSMECVNGEDSCLSLCRAQEAAQGKRLCRAKASMLQQSAQRVHGAFVACCIRCHVYSKGNERGKGFANVLKMGSSGHYRSTPPRYIGVNYALHHCVNRGQTLNGILKGCAEQNAFGAVAAGGLPYTAVSHLYLASCVSVVANPEEPQGVALTQSAHTNPFPALDTKFPCPVCWRNIERVALARRDEQLPPLCLYLWVPTEEAALCGMSHAKQQITRLDGHIDISFVVS